MDFEARRDPDAMQRTIVAPSLFAVVILLGLERRRIEKLAGEEMRTREGPVCRAAGTRERQERCDGPDGCLAPRLRNQSRPTEEHVG